MKFHLSTLIGILGLLLVLLLVASTAACSNESAEPPLTSTLPPPTAEATSALESTPTPTPQVAAVPTEPQPARPPTSTVTATPSQTENGIAAATAQVAVPTATPTSAITSQPEDTRLGGTLNLVSRQVVPHLDVHSDVSSALAAWGPGIVYSRMMRFRDGGDVELPSLAVQCEVCSSWEMTDGITFEFRLRDDVVWQDLQPVEEGRLDAADISYSYERQRSEGMPNSVLLHMIDAVESSAEDKLRITLLAPDADFLVALADGHSKIVAREAVEINGDLRAGPTIGTGAWVLEEEEDMTFTLRRNESYFLEDAPLLDRIRIHTITDEETAYAAFRVNNVDVHRLRSEQWAEFRHQKPDATMLPFKEIGVGLEVAFNTAQAPFGELNVRRAAMLSMRPSRAVDEVWQGAAYLTQGVPLASAGWQLDDEQVGGFFGDPTRATALLSEVGWVAAGACRDQGGGFR